MILKGPFGAKASGEGTQLAGVRFKTLPVTQGKVLEALQGKQNKWHIGDFIGHRLALSIEFSQTFLHDDRKVLKAKASQSSF